jgi:hypothetical protein
MEAIPGRTRHSELSHIGKWTNYLMSPRTAFLNHIVTIKIFYDPNSLTAVFAR